MFRRYWSANCWCVRFAVTAGNRDWKILQSAAAERSQRLVYEHSIRPYADNSRRSIRSHWRHWITFCAIRDEVAMPIVFADLKEFFDAMIDAS
jgi:hypothetical protein